MKRLVQEKEKALYLRRSGLSYKEILEQVKVSKSSLSLWLKELPLTENEQRFLEGRKTENISRGRIRAATSNRMRRAIREGFLERDAKREFMANINDPFFQIGLALYWAEGAKRNTYFAFVNSDPEMIGLMVSWIRRYMGVKDSEIRARLYTHEPFAEDNNERFWGEITQIPEEYFKKTVYKKSLLPVKKRPNYRGCLRIELMKVVHLRKMLLWQQLLIEHCKEKGYC